MAKNDVSTYPPWIRRPVPVTLPVPMLSTAPSSPCASFGPSTTFSMSTVAATPSIKPSWVPLMVHGVSGAQSSASLADAGADGPAPFRLSPTAFAKLRPSV